MVVVVVLLLSLSLWLWLLAASLLLVPSPMLSYCRKLLFLRLSNYHSWSVIFVNSCVRSSHEFTLVLVLSLLQIAIIPLLVGMTVAMTTVASG